MGINLHKLSKKLGLEHCVVQREPGFVLSGYFVHNVMVEKHVIIITINSIIIFITKIVTMIRSLQPNNFVQALFGSVGYGHKCTSRFPCCVFHICHLGFVMKHKYTYTNTDTKS